MTHPQPPQLPLIVKGSRGHVTFDGWTTTVRHTALGNRQTASVPLDQLAGVDLRPASLGTGMFTLLTAGTVAPTRQRLVTRAPLSLAILPGQTRRFERLRDVLLAALQARNAAPAGLSWPPQSPPPPSLVGELERLAALARAGAISAQEFAAAKARLLGGQH